MPESAPKNFEKKIEKLEKIIQSLEDGSLGLDKSIEKFDEGVAVYSECKKLLDIAEKKITILTEKLKETDF